MKHHTEDKATFDEVVASIITEREHQDKVWNSETTTSEGRHSIEDFLLYMYDYMDQARMQLTRNSKSVADELALDTMRKIVTLGVACMQQNGVVPRV